MSRKPHLTVYLERATLDELERFAAERRKPRSLVAEATIQSFLTPDDRDRQTARPDRAYS